MRGHRASPHPPPPTTALLLQPLLWHGLVEWLGGAAAVDLAPQAAVTLQRWQAGLGLGLRPPAPGTLVGGRVGPGALARLRELARLLVARGNLACAAGAVDVGEAGLLAAGERVPGADEVAQGHVDHPGPDTSCQNDGAFVRLDVESAAWLSCGRVDEARSRQLLLAFERLDNVHFVPGQLRHGALIVAVADCHHFRRPFKQLHLHDNI